MPTSILAPALTAGTSTDVVVAKGDVATLGIYAATPANLDSKFFITVEQVTPGAPNVVAVLSNSVRAVQVAGPGTYRVKRPVTTGTPFGVFKEDA